MTINERDRDIVVAALKHAAPYIRMYKHKIFIVKAGGEVFLNPAATRALIEQLAILHQVGIRLILVHGAGPQSTARASELGLKTNMVQGRRVTDAATLEVSNAVNAEVRQQILDVCASLDLPAKGLCGTDGPIRASKRAPVKIDGEGEVDFGFVGDIQSIDTALLQTVLDQGVMPVISPLGADSDGTLLNINADTIAAETAAALQVEKLILATGAPGVLEDLADPTSLVSYIDIAGLHRLRDSGSLAGGMLPKATAIETAIEGGVPRVHVISYALPDCLLLEIFTNEGTGTLVVRSVEALTEAEQSAGPLADVKEA